VQLVLDAETRGTATAEQYEKALAWLQDWRAEHFDAEEWGTPADWAEARELNDEFEAQADAWWPGIKELLSEYYELSSRERTAFKKEHPEIQDYYDARDWWGEQAGHEVWARFYLGKEMGEAGAWTGGYGGYTGKGYYQKQYYPRYYYRGGGGGGGGDWQFARMARQVPKFYLQTPKTWTRWLPGRKPYRARGTPWVFGKWRTGGGGGQKKKT